MINGSAARETEAGLVKHITLPTCIPRSPKGDRNCFASNTSREEVKESSSDVRNDNANHSCRLEVSLGFFFCFVQHQLEGVKQ